MIRHRGGDDDGVEINAAEEDGEDLGSWTFPCLNLAS